MLRASCPPRALSCADVPTEEVPEGTRLTVTESGFDQIPVGRRAKAYRENDAGWTGQLKNITRYLAGTS